MKRPEFIESLEAAATYDEEMGIVPYWGTAGPRRILELIRYVKVLEKTLNGARGHAGSAVDSWIRDAERELYPEAQP